MGYRSTRQVFSLRQILARRKRRPKFTEYRVQQPVKQPAAFTGAKLPATRTR